MNDLGMDSDDEQPNQSSWEITVPEMTLLPVSEQTRNPFVVVNLCYKELTTNLRANPSLAFTEKVLVTIQALNAECKSLHSSSHMESASRRAQLPLIGKGPSERTSSNNVMP